MRNRFGQAPVSCQLSRSSASLRVSASNFTGHPCLHLRAGFLHSGTRHRGTLGARAPMIAPGPAFLVPQGISLWGRLFDEQAVLRVGLALERRLAVADRRPTLAA